MCGFLVGVGAVCLHCQCYCYEVSSKAFIDHTECPEALGVRVNSGVADYLVFLALVALGLGREVTGDWLETGDW